MKSSELLRMLKQDGWIIIRQKGSHIVMKHPLKEGTLSIPFHGHKEVGIGFLRDTLRKAKIKL